MSPRDARVFPFRGGRSLTLAVLAAATLCLAVAPAAATVRVELKFAAPTVTQRSDGSVFVAAPECMTFNGPGLPLLPARRAVVLLPPGETVTAIRVLPEGLHEIEGAYLVAPAQRPQPNNLTGPFPLTGPDPAVYGSNDIYPSAAARLVTEQKGWGHGLAFLRVFPVSYRPSSGKLSWHERVIVEVDTAVPRGGNAHFIPRLRNSERAIDRLSRLVVNPQDLSLYKGARPATLSESQIESDYYPYVIVTSAALKEAFQPVAEFQSSRGLRARIMTVEEILESYPDGRDVPESIRLFIIDAYENWGTDYVLLGGDVEEVPKRDLYWSFELDTYFEEEWIPGDCYFEGLDGTWNTDNDGFWGEPGEEDLVGEIAVGRIPANTPTEIGNWRHKNEMYTEQPVVSQVKKALFLGELLSEPSGRIYGDTYMDEIQDGADTCGFTTVGYPADYDKQTLYDSEAVWDSHDLIPLINEGFPTTHHNGHSNTEVVMRMDVSDIAHLTNDGKTASYMLNYSQGCYAGAFDFTDSICEAFITDVHGSAALLCNSRYGWMDLLTCSPSQFINREFVDARYGEGIVTAGRMNVDSKADLVWVLDAYSRYVHYEVNLFGDPAIPQWGSVLGELALQHAGKYVIGQGNYQVTVTAGGVPVPGATVTLYSADFSVWASGETDEFGVVLLNPVVPKAMTLYLKAVKADYLPAADDLKATRK